jgi:hypothetical protein
MRLAPEAKARSTQHSTDLPVILLCLFLSVCISVYCSMPACLSVYGLFTSVYKSVYCHLPIYPSAYST